MTDAPIEITIKVKDDEQTLSEKILQYDAITLSHDDANLKSLVEAQLAKWHGSEQMDVYISAKMMW